MKYLIPIFLALTACAGSTTMIADSGSTHSVRLAEDLKHIPCFVPNPEKTAYTSAYLDLPKGSWIFLPGAEPEHIVQTQK